MTPHATSTRTSRPSALMVGLGVVGLPLARMLAQAGWRLTLVDPDSVSQPNLGKTFYEAGQVKRPKVDAACALIKAHDPRAQLAVLPKDVRSLGVGAFLAHDLVVVAPDNRATDRYCSERANLAGRPSVRMATTGDSRLVSVRLVPAPTDQDQPCGACAFSPRDHALADQRISCVSDTSRLPEAGRPTQAHHGLLAASMAMEAIANRELAPARTLTWVGGRAPTLDTTELLQTTTCKLSKPRVGHGPVPWERLPQPADELTMGVLLELACTRLAAPARRITADMDAPWCLGRCCAGERCGQPIADGFWHFGPQGLRCPRCGEAVRQAQLSALHRVEATVLEPRAAVSLAALDAPNGLSIRFHGPGGRCWSVCTAWSINEVTHDTSE